jgi:hypothetical protein
VLTSSRYAVQKGHHVFLTKPPVKTAAEVSLPVFNTLLIHLAAPAAFEGGPQPRRSRRHRLSQAFRPHLSWCVCLVRGILLLMFFGRCSQQDSRIRRLWVFLRLHDAAQVSTCHVQGQAVRCMVPLTSSSDLLQSWAGISSDISYYLNSHHVDIHVWVNHSHACGSC